MTTLTLGDIETSVQAHLATEITCETILGDDTRVACIMPLQYPSGDSITIWVEQLGSKCRVSDYGEALIDLLTRDNRTRGAFEVTAKDIGARWGVEVNGGSLIAHCDQSALGEAVWRATMVAYRVAQAAQRLAPSHGPQERAHDAFVNEVAQELSSRHLPVKRGWRIEGQSGRVHRATIFVPAVHVIVEPIDAEGHYSQITSVYAKFGDLAKKNGNRPISIINDRYARLDDGLAAMLLQVSEVVDWTQRGEWLAGLS